MLPVIVPFAAALLFPLIAMALKRAMELNRDPWLTLLVSNAAIAVVFLPLFAWEGKPPPMDKAWQPLAAGLVFFIAQVAAFKSFATGDLSVAIPAQGTKVLLVAAFTLLLIGENVGPRQWGAAGLTVAAIYFLQDRESGKRIRARLVATLIYALVASAAFAAFDVSVQKWTPDWGMQRFGPWVFLVQAALSASLLWFPGRRRLIHPAKTWLWLGLGATGMALITFALVLVIGLYGKATLVNILFNSRCVWSVVFVWLLGSWFANKEAKTGGRRAMAHRLLGAGFMMAAIGLALT
jgi:drug/metabolite transporter (DMT)-like permease